MPKDFRPTELAPIIENRKRVQEIALDLLNFIHGREEQIAIDPTWRRIVMLCVGATFSLWRAVPLVHINRQPIDNVTVSADYLEQIVRHNAITYGDDERSRVWSFGFYLSNVRYRVREICSEEICQFWPDGGAAIDALNLRDRVIPPRDPIYTAPDRIRESIAAVGAIVDALKVSK